MIGASEFTSTALLATAFGVLLAASVLLNRALERLGVPVVLLFLVLGMLAGSEGIGGIEFEDYQFAFRLGTLALVLILFDGGFHTPIANLRGCWAPAGVLATVGVVATAALVAGFSYWMGLPWSESLLLGAVVSSTDAAAVFSVLRGGNLRLPRRMGTTLELESGLNDPMAVILTVAVAEAILHQKPPTWMIALEVPMQLAIGLGAGLLLGFGTRLLLPRIRLGTGGLFPVLTLAVALLAFGAATLLHGSGFLAVYTAAMVLGNSPIPYRSGLSRVHDALAWLSQTGMFLMLGLLVFPSQLWPVAGIGLVISLFLAFVARPLAALVCLLPFRMPLREVGYIGWVGLRGAVPIILATFPVLAGVPDSIHLFNVVFFVVVINAIVPGATIRALTLRLFRGTVGTPAPAAAIEINSTRMVSGELLSFFVTPPVAVCDATLAEIPFPADAAAILVVRGEQLLAPRGNTVLQVGDHVYIFCRPADRPLIELLFGRPESEEP